MIRSSESPTTISLESALEAFAVRAAVSYCGETALAQHLDRCLGTYSRTVQTCFAMGAASSEFSMYLGPALSVSVLNSFEKVLASKDEPMLRWAVQIALIGFDEDPATTPTAQAQED